MEKIIEGTNGSPDGWMASMHRLASGLLADIITSKGFWCRQPTGIGDNEIWRIVKRNGTLYLPDVGSKTTSVFSGFAGISASN